MTAENLKKIGIFGIFLVRKMLSKEKRGVGWRSSVWMAVFTFHGLAYADVWVYVDAKGVTHFAAEQLSEKYELFFKSSPIPVQSESDASPTGKPSNEIEPARPAASAVAKSKLLAYFDVSPNFKAVKHHLREASQTHKIDFELLQALIATESGFDANAVSPRGAVGLMQLMPPTAERYGVKADANTPIEKKLTDPQTNIRAGSRYLRDLIHMFPGKLELALAAYNAGEGAVQRYGNKIPPFKETQNYVATVMQIYQQLKPPAAIVQRQQLSEKGRLQPEPAPIASAPGQIHGRGNMVTPSGSAVLHTPAQPFGQPFIEFK